MKTKYWLLCFLISLSCLLYSFDRHPDHKNYTSVFEVTGTHRSYDRYGTVYVVLKDTRSSRVISLSATPGWFESAKVGDRHKRTVREFIDIGFIVMNFKLALLILTILLASGLLTEMLIRIIDGGKE